MSDSEKAALEKADAEWVEPEQWVIDMWELGFSNPGVYGVDTCGCYNRKTGFFEAYKTLLDITTEQAKHIIIAGKIHGDQDVRYYQACSKIRTNMPKYYAAVASGFTSAVFNWCSNIELVVLYNAYFSSTAAFSNCSKLRQIGTPEMGLYRINNIASGQSAYNGCPNVEIIYGSLGNYNLDVSVNSKLSCANFRWWVDHCLASNPITITVHADIFDAMTGKGSYPFNGGSQEEWEKVFSDALEKQISFATT